MTVKYVYSNVDPDCLLLSYIKKEDIISERIDLSPERECLQVSAKKINMGKIFKPHKHNALERNTDQTNESWMFLEGSVRANFYDLDDTLILQEVFKSGDCVVVFNAGHGFDVLEDNTILYEFKNGPYYGQIADKTFIEG